MEEEYSYDELDIAKRELSATLFDDVKKEKQPVAIILGGQPASGKLQFLNFYRTKFFLINNLLL